MVLLLKYVVVVLVMFGSLYSVPGTARLCCDPDCRTPISYGRTVERHITKERGFLSYPSTAIVTVFAKGALLADEGEFWEAEIQGKRGLILSHSINELTFKCTPVPIAQDDHISKEEEGSSDGLPAPAVRPEATVDETPPTSVQTPPPVDTPILEGVADGAGSGTYSSGSDESDGSKLLDKRDRHDNADDAAFIDPDRSNDLEEQEDDVKSSSFHSSEESVKNDFPEQPAYVSTTPIQFMHVTPSVPVEHSSTVAAEQPLPSVEPEAAEPSDSYRGHLSREDAERLEDEWSSSSEDSRMDFGQEEEEKEKLFRDMEFYDDKDDDDDEMKAFEEELRLSENDVGGNLEPDHSPPSTPPHLERQPGFEWEGEEAGAQRHDGGEWSQAEEEEEEEEEEVDSQVQGHQDAGIGQNSDTGHQYSGTGAQINSELEDDDDSPQDDNIGAGQVDDDGFGKYDSVEVGPPTGGYEEAPSVEASARKREEEEEEELIQRRIEHRLKQMAAVEDGLIGGRVPEHIRKWREQHRLRDSLVVPPSPSPLTFGSEEEDRQPARFDGTDDPSPRTLGDAVTTDSSVEGKGRQEGERGGGGLTETPLPYRDDEMEKRERGLRPEVLPVEGGDPVKQLDPTYLDDEDYDTDDYWNNIDDNYFNDDDDDEDYYLDSQPTRPSSVLLRPQTVATQAEVADSQTASTRAIFGAPSLLNIQATPLSLSAEKEEEEEEDPGDHWRNENYGGRVQETPLPHTTPLTHLQEGEEEESPRTDPMDVPDEVTPTYTEAPPTPAHTEAATPPTEEGHYEGLIQRPSFDSQQQGHCVADNCGVDSTEEEEERGGGGEVKMMQPGLEDGLRDENRSSVGMVYNLEGLRSLMERYQQWLSIQDREMLWASVVLSGVVWLCAFYPILGVCCLESCRKSRSIKKMQTNRGKLDKMIIDLRSAKGDAVSKARGTEEKVLSQEASLAQLRQEMATLSQSKAQLEAHYQTVAGSLESTRMELAQSQEQAHQLQSQLTQEQTQVAAQLSEKTTALQQVEYLSQQLQQQCQAVLGLEGARDQLEQDKFNIQSSLSEMEGKRDQLAKELDEARKLTEAVQVELASAQTDSQRLRDSLEEKEQEAKRMGELLSTVTAIEGDGEVGREETVRSLLDTRKAVEELGMVSGERDQLSSSLQTTLLQLETAQAENMALTDRVTALDSEKAEAVQTVQTLECQMAGLKTLFQETQERLQSQVFHKERQSGIDKTRETDLLEQLERESAAKDKAREEMDKFREQLREMEEAYRAQVLEHQQRATESLTDMRKTEQALKQANKEVISLKKQLAETEAEAASVMMMRPIPMSHAHPARRPRPPSSGPPSHLPPQGAPQQQQQLPRPESAPRLGPRTSSPNTAAMATTLPLVPPPTSSSHMLNTSVPALGSNRLNEYQTGGAPPNAVGRPSSTSPSIHPHQQQQQQHRRSGSIDRPTPSPQPAAYHQQAATEPAFTTTVTAPHSFSVPSTVTVTRRASGPPPAPLYRRTQPALVPATTAVGMIPSVSEVSLTNAAPPVMNQLPPGGQMPSVRPYPPPHPRGPDSVTPIGDPTSAMSRPMMLPPPASRGGYPPPPHYAGGPYGPVRPRPPPPGGYPPRMPYRHRSDPAIMRHPLPPPRFMGPPPQGYGPSTVPVPIHNPGSVPNQAPPPDSIPATGSISYHSYQNTQQEEDSQA